MAVPLSKIKEIRIGNANSMIIGNLSIDSISNTLQTHHVDSTLKRCGNELFQVVSKWNPRHVFVG